MVHKILQNPITNWCDLMCYGSVNIFVPFVLFVDFLLSKIR